MSQFDKYSQSQYVKKLCSFLGKHHQATKTFMSITKPPKGILGRAHRHPEYAVEALELAVNTKAERCESSSTTFPERYLLARDYREWTNGDVARELNVSREAVRKWQAGISLPRQMDLLAKAFDVPLQWLQDGGEKHLPPNSHLGVRVGQVSMDCREKLYGLSLSAFGKAMRDDVDDLTLNHIVESILAEQVPMSKLARHAGGRWLLVEGELVFSAWIPIEPHQPSRATWAPAVEKIIDEELDAKHSVYAAWYAIKDRCETLCLAYPQKITLYKRIQSARTRQKRFGVNTFGLLGLSSTTSNQNNQEI